MKGFLFSFIILYLSANVQNFENTKVHLTSKWSKKVLKTQDEKRKQIKYPDMIEELVSAYYEKASKSVFNKCNILKKIGGQWLGGCGFFDGEKLVCMDGIYKSIKNQNCLVYSFGLSDNWDFEVFMAQLGTWSCSSF